MATAGELNHIAACLIDIEQKIEASNALLQRLVDLEQAREEREQAQAEFVKLLTTGAEGPSPARQFEDYREAGESWEVMVAGVWSPANHAEQEQIRQMVQRRGKRR